MDLMAGLMAEIVEITAGTKAKVISETAEIIAVTKGEIIEGIITEIQTQIVRRSFKYIKRKHFVLNVKSRMIIFD